MILRERQIFTPDRVATKPNNPPIIDVKLSIDTYVCGVKHRTPFSDRPNIEISLSHRRFGKLMQTGDPPEVTKSVRSFFTIALSRSIRPLSFHDHDSLPVMPLIRDAFIKLPSDRTFSLREITRLALTGFSSLATRTFPKQYYLLSAILNSRNF